MQNSIYKIKYLLFLSWDWEAWCLTQSEGVIPPPPERNTAWNKGRKCFHCLGAPNNLIRPCPTPRASNHKDRPKRTSRTLKKKNKDTHTHTLIALLYIWLSISEFVPRRKLFLSFQILIFAACSTLLPGVAESLSPPAKLYPCSVIRVFWEPGVLKRTSTWSARGTTG